MLEHMMELNADNIANLTQYLIREYYKLNTDPLFSVLEKIAFGWDQEIFWYLARKK